METVFKSEKVDINYQDFKDDLEFLELSIIYPAFAINLLIFVYK